MKGFVILSKRFLLRDVLVFMIMLFVISVATISVSSAVTYTNSKGTVTVTCGTYKKKFTAKKYGKNFSKALNAALETARKKGKAKTPAKVKLSKGNYSLDRTIKIYSNTTLIAKNCRIRYYGNLLRNGYKSKAYSATGYDGAKNITIDGGTWDALVPYSQAGTSNWRIQHSTLRFAHCKNITIKNCSFVGNYNCHDIEFGAVKDSKITNCSFSNTKAVNTFKNDGGREAIQFDVATYEAMPEFVSYDKTPTKNIEVCNCSFKNKFRGVGSHHAVPGKLFDKISIHDNTFSNIGGIAVYGVYWTNSEIYNNKMTNVGLGVDIRSMTIGSGENFRNMDKLTCEQCNDKIKKSTLYIYGNTITIRVMENNYVRPTGIRVMGEHYVNYDLNTGIKPGTYKVYNVHIGEDKNGEQKPNSISGNVACGVQLNYAVDSAVTGNTINLSKSVEETSNAVEIKGCDNTVVEKNTLKNGTYQSGRGVFLTYPANLDLESTNIRISENTISNFNKDGILAHYTENSQITNNKITKTAQSAVYLQRAKNNEVNSNTFSDNGSYGVYVNDGSESNTVSLNTISNSSDGILIKGSTDNTASENTIKECTVYGAYIYNTQETNTLSKNIISNCPSGVTLQKSLLSEVKENIISDVSEYGVRVYSSSADNTIKGNVISNNQYGVFAQNSENTKVLENSVSGSTVYGVNIRGGNIALIQDNEISNCITNPIRINYGADKVDINRNTINHSGKDSIYINGSSDSNQLVEKFVEVHDNIITTPDNKPSITGAYGNIAIQAYSNILNGVRESGKEPRPNYMRFKGDTSEFTWVYDELKITDLTLEELDDRNHLEWNSDYDDVTYRVAAVLEDGTIEQIALTTEKSFDHIFADDGEKYTAVEYWVAPIVFYENIKYVGMSMTADYNPGPPPTTVTETTVPDTTAETSADTSSVPQTEATDTTEAITSTEPSSTQETTAPESTRPQTDPISTE